MIESGILLVFLVLAATIVLLVTEVLRVDVVAILVMLSLAWLGLVTPAEAFSGFASNAVISIMAVMIMGYGIDRTGVMTRLSRKVLALAGTGERRLVAAISAVVGCLSAFMQNIGSAALFLPAMMRISKRTGIPASRLLMPMGFAAILGGTLTMIGSSPLILLNDLLQDGGYEPFGIFSVTPVGIALLATGIGYFAIFGRKVLPAGPATGPEPGSQEEIMETWQLQMDMHHYLVPMASRAAGRTREDLQLRQQYNLYLLALKEREDILYAPWRFTVVKAGQTLTVLGAGEDADRFAADFGLVPAPGQEALTEEVGGENAGFAEVIVRPRADIIGRTLREFSFRRKYGVEPLILLSGEEEARHDLSDTTLSAGDTLVVYGPWNRLRAIGSGREFVIVTPVEEEGARGSKAAIAIACFAGGIVLTLSGVQLSLGLLTGAIGMVLFRVISIQEAYRSIDWRTVFLLAGLIPLGIAMEKTGGAAFLATGLMGFLGGAHPLLILLGVAVLATFFSLFMSNVAATVLLVPLVLIIGADTGIDPRGLALLVAVCASNSFVLPTHQVNAFIMGPGGYHNHDFLKAGGIMTILFIVVAVAGIYLLFV